MSSCISIVLPVLHTEQVPSAVGTVDALARNAPVDREFELVLVLAASVAEQPGGLGVLVGDVRTVVVPDGASFGEAGRAGAGAAVGPLLLVTAPGLPALWADFARVLDGAGTTDDMALVDRDAVVACGELAGFARTPVGLAALAQLSPAPAPEPVPRPELVTAERALRDGISVVVHAPHGMRRVESLLEQVRQYGESQWELVVVDGLLGGEEDRVPARGRTVRVPAAGMGTVAAVNAGLCAAQGTRVVLLPESAAVGRFALQTLGAVLDKGYAAVGARTNGGALPQGVRGQHYESTAGLRRFREEWRRHHRGQVRDVDLLTAAPVVLDSAAARRAGLLDEQFVTLDGAVADLAQRLRRDAGRLAVAEDVFIHREAPPLAPREWHRPVGPRAGTAAADAVDEARHDRRRLAALHGWESVGGSATACLIVKDEQTALPSCLRSLAGVVDEVLVCDTGSTDDTVALARAVGATVVQEAWRDDFAAARNAALSAATGEWVLQIDADEWLSADDLVGFWSVLEGLPVDAVNLRIDNVADGVGAARTWHSHTYTRLLRRARCRYVHRLHEQVVTRSGDELVIVPSDAVTFLHWGYRASVMRSRDKRARNYALATARAAENMGDWDSLFELGRVQYLNHELDEAERTLLHAVSHMDETNVQWGLAHALLALAAESAGRLAQAVQRAAVAHSAEPDEHAHLYARLLRDSGDCSAALTVLGSACEGGGRRGRTDLDELTGTVLANLGRRDQAYGLLGQLALSDPDGFSEWDLLLELSAEVASSPELASRLVEQSAPGLLQALLTAPTELRQAFQRSLLAAVPTG